jgi:hypothetical protein
MRADDARPVQPFPAPVFALPYQQQQVKLYVGQPLVLIVVEKMLNPEGQAVQDVYLASPSLLGGPERQDQGLRVGALQLVQVSQGQVQLRAAQAIQAQLDQVGD